LAHQFWKSEYRFSRILGGKYRELIFSLGEMLLYSDSMKPQKSRRIAGFCPVGWSK